MLLAYLSRAAAVIGGADGPTAIYVTSTVNTTTIIIIVALVAGLAVGLVAGILYRRTKNKKDDR